MICESSSVENPFSTFPIYLKIESGGVSAPELISELESCGVFVSRSSKILMSKPEWSPGEKEVVRFIRTKVRDLRFTKRPKLTDIARHIHEFGHKLCKPSDAPAIVRALQRRPGIDFFWIAMNGIQGNTGEPLVFRVESADMGRLALKVGRAKPYLGWHLNHDVVFRY